MSWGGTALEGNVLGRTVLEGNSLGVNCLGGELFRGELSWEEIV